MKTLPMFLHSFSGPHYDDEKHILFDGSTYYGLEASEMNYPESDKIGDFQLEILNSKNVSYNDHTVFCQADWCNGLCRAPQSKMNRFRTTKNDFKILKNKNVVTKGKHGLEISKPIQATFNLMIKIIILIFPV